MVVYTASKQAVLAKLSMSDEHRYTKDGIIVPGVTSVISELTGLAGIPASIREAAFQRGNIVHRLTELVDSGLYYNTNFEADAICANLDGYIAAWEAFKRDYNVDILASEEKVFHTKFWYAGTLDRIVIMDWHGVRRCGILDIKTGHLVDAYALQTAAYQAAVLDGYNLPSNIPDHRFVVQLKEDGKYAVLEHDDKSDFGVFAAQLTVNNWRLKHGS